MVRPFRTVLPAGQIWTSIAVCVQFYGHFLRTGSCHCVARDATCTAAARASGAIRRQSSEHLAVLEANVRAGLLADHVAAERERLARLERLRHGLLRVIEVTFDVRAAAHAVELRKQPHLFHARV